MTSEVQSPDVLASREAGGAVIRGSILRTAAFAAGTLVGLVSTPLLVRHLGVADYDAYVTVIALVFIVAGVTEGGLGAVGVREYARDPAGGRALVANLLGLRLVLAAVGALSAIAFALVAGYERAVVLGTVIAGGGLLLTNVQFTLTVPLQARLRLGWLSALELLTAVGTAVGVVVLVLADAELLPFFAVSGVVAAVAVTVTARLVRGDASLRPSADLAAWRELGRSTLAYGAAIALAVVYAKVAIISVSLLSTERETSLFGLAWRVLDIVNVVPWLLATSAFPVLARAAHDDADRLRYALRRLFDVALIVGGWFSLSIVVGAPFAVAVVGGEEFEGATPVLRVLGLTSLGTFLIAVWAHALLSLRAHRELIVANGLALLVGIALSLVLIPAEGAMGAAVLTVALEALLALVYGALLARRHGLPPPRALVPRWALALALALPLGLLLPAHAVVATLAASAVYFVVLAVTRAIPPEIGEALRGWRAGRRAG